MPNAQSLHRTEQPPPSRANSDPYFSATASAGIVRSPHGQSLREFLIAHGCDCAEYPYPPLKGYDFIEFTLTTDYSRVEALATLWLRTGAECE